MFSFMRRLCSYGYNILYGFITLLILFSPIYTFSQDYPKKDFIAPVKIPITTSGTFAEMRSNHFHSGFDIRTGGKIGELVFCPFEGEVSRIKVQAFGGGKNLYVSHTNGFTTVYMHLDSYYGAIGEFVRDYQYAHKTYEFDVQVPKGRLMLKQGDTIALSGNSGSSAGPHLHYEIRDTRTENIINPLFFGLELMDTIPPELLMIKLLQQNISYKLNPKEGELGIKEFDTLFVDWDFSLGITALDRSNDCSGNNGVYEYNLYVDDALFWNFRVDEFSFNDSRYVNACIDYYSLEKDRQRVLVTRKLPNNSFRDFKTFDNQGVISIQEEDFKTLRFELKDFAGNTKNFTFYVIARCNQVGDSLGEIDNYRKLISWSKNNVFDTSGIQVIIPKGALYEDNKLYYSLDTIGKRVCHNVYSPAFLHKDMTIKIDIPENIVDNKQFISKLVIAELSNKKLEHIGGRIEKGVIVAKTKLFGRFTLALDTIAPTIISRNIKKNKRIANNQKHLIFRISDNLSGIKSYNGFLNGQWILFEYDGKRASIVCDLDSMRLKRGKNKLLIKLVDAVGNSTNKEFEFIY
ncbi:MAG: metalloendopeptidase-like rane protein [Bacteroidetes bacterium]|nr:metalloendopeptidase-like rane protein [Bacteroidota bacterium]